MPRDRKPGKRSGVLDFATTWGGAALVVLIGFVVTCQFVQPAPPDRISIATGSRDGAYYHDAMQYQRILARDGCTLELVETAGSLETLKRLTGDNGGVDLAMVQGGIPAPTDNIAIESIGSLFEDIRVQLDALRAAQQAPVDAGAEAQRIAPSPTTRNGTDIEEATDSIVEDNGYDIAAQFEELVEVLDREIREGLADVTSKVRRIRSGFESFFRKRDKTASAPCWTC
ncbi:MAG: hypothetical protein LJE91_05730 [Gammaproteobacteria bacterium]|nr:hypothetical protein [Gammaproteobacteria bacterium]